MESGEDLLPIHTPGPFLITVERVISHRKNWWIFLSLVIELVAFLVVEELLGQAT
jgi:hypothetical protein